MNWKLILLICAVGASEKVFSQDINNASTGAAITEVLGVYDKLFIKGEGSYSNNPNVADLHVGFGLKPKGTAGSVSGWRYNLMFTLAVRGCLLHVIVPLVLIWI